MASGNHLLNNQRKVKKRGGRAARPCHSCLVFCEMKIISHSEIIPTFVFVWLPIFLLLVGCIDRENDLENREWSHLVGLRLADAVEDLGEKPEIVMPNFTGGVPDAENSLEGEDIFGVPQIYYADFLGVTTDDGHLRVEVRRTDEIIRRVFFLRRPSNRGENENQSGGMAEPVALPSAFDRSEGATKMDNGSWSGKAKARSHREGKD